LLRQFILALESLFMAVARIFTRHPEAATSLSEELRRKGYTVEVIVQNQPPLRKDQDVEIDFEFLRRAESPTYSEEIITEFAPDTVALAAARGPLTLAGTPPQIIDVPVDALDNVHVPMQMPAMPPVAILDEPQRVFLQNENLATAQDEASRQPALQENENRGWENRISVPRDAGLGNGFVPAPVMHDGSHDHKSAPLKFLAGVENLAHRIARASREQINLRTARMREARHQRQLALEARQIRDEERAAELQVAREAAAERLQSLLRERGDEVPQPVPQISAEMEIESEAALVGAAQEPPRPAVVRAPIAAFQPPVWKQLLFKPEFIFAGAAAMASIVVVGLALTSYRPKATTAKLDESAVVTSAPNSAVTTSAGKSARPARVARRSGKPLLMAVNHITTRHLGDDVTIRLYPQETSTRGFATQAKPAAHNRAQPDLRRISDLEN
jgi:hypothetical protein